MRAVFLDRDGVINDVVYYPEIGLVDSPFTVEQFHLRPRVGEAIQRLNRLQFKVIVVSNQPGIAKRHFSARTLAAMDRKMKRSLARQGARLDAALYCLHHPGAALKRYRLRCACRKPQPGLLLQAATDFGIDLERSYMVGDSASDVQAGQRAGCRTIYLGSWKCDVCRLMERQGVRPHFICQDLWEASRQIQALEGGDGDFSRFRRREGDSKVGRPGGGGWRHHQPFHSLQRQGLRN
ncbi:MAG TPA: HAD family hydrolase [Candidatus Acidoferrales bacterium]